MNKNKAKNADDNKIRIPIKKAECQKKQRKRENREKEKTEKRKGIYFMAKEKGFLPVNKKEMEERGWEQADFIYVLEMRM